MAITKQKKTEIISKLKKIFADSRTVAFINFHALTVKRAQELRRKLRENSSGYFVAKKTLIRKAFQDTGAKGAMPALPGEIGIAYLTGAGDDVTAPARELFAFEKKFEKAVALVGGVFEGLFKGREDMVAFASIPSRQTLLAQFVNLLNSPMQKLVIGLDSIAKSKQK